MYNIPVFISHSWSYSGHYDRLAEWLFENEWQNAGVPIAFFDKSVPKESPIHNARNTKELRAAIYSRIEESRVVIIPTGMYANYSDWIQEEIDGARFHRRPIVAVNPWAQERKSSVVSQAAVETVGWRAQSVAHAAWHWGH